MIEEHLPSLGSWDGRSRACDVRNPPKISGGNSALFSYTLMIAARFLDDLTAGRERPISFRFGVRDDSAGFVKLDVLGTMIVVGARIEEKPLARVLHAAVRARQLSMMRNDSLVMFVPIVAFGQTDSNVFYVESPNQPGMPSAWFMKAGIDFLAKQIAPRVAEAESIDLPAYLKVMENEGEDPLDLLRWQPLVRTILDGTPGDLIAETRRQIAAELNRKI